MDPISILTLIGTANSAYATLKQGSTNAGELLGCMGKFFQAKQKIDKQAEVDEKSGKVDSKAFGARIELMRMEKELEQFITYECEGWVIAEWQKFKAQAQAEDQGPTLAQKKAARIKAQKDDTVMAAIKALGIIFAIGLTMLLTIGEKVKEALTGN